MSKLQTYSGKVVEGNRIGRGLGFPTANIEMPSDADISFGVYYSIVKIEGVSYNSISNYGSKPTIGAYTPLLEVHIFDFNENLYGKVIEVELVEFVRGEVKFESYSNLQKQIDQDIAYVKSNYIEIL